MTFFNSARGSRPNRRYGQWLSHQYGTVAEVNHHLATSYADEAGFLAATNVPEPSAALTEVRAGFLALIAEQYFSVAAKALRERIRIIWCWAVVLPGVCRSRSWRRPANITMSSPSTPIPQVDFENVWAPDGTGGAVARVPRELTGYYAVARKPILITEWSFPALDSGLPCQHGAGMRVDTQEQRAACYRIFANAMADLPFVIGYHYFMWADEPAPGISASFPEDSNYGLVNEKDETYEILVKAATEVNRSAESRHARSAVSGDLELIAEGNRIEVANTNATAAHGLVRISVGRPKPHRRHFPPCRTKAAPVAAGPKRGLRGTAELGRHQTAHPQRPAGGAADSGQCIRQHPCRRAGRDRRSAAGGRVAASARSRPDRKAPAARHRLDETRPPRSPDRRRDLVRDGKDGNLFDQIQAGDLALGRLVFGIHRQIEGREQWTECDRIESLQLQEQPDAWVVEAVMSHGEAGSENSFRAAARLAVFKHDGVMLARPLWVENAGARSWKLAEVYWFCRPAIGGLAC